MFNMTHEHVEGSLKEVVDTRWGVSPRKIMQFVGTEMFQHKIQELMPWVGRQFWITKLADKIITSPVNRVVVSDLRFPHEFEELKKAGSLFVIRVHRLTDIDETDSHSSETEFNDVPIDAEINNCGTVSELSAKVDVLLRNAGIIHV
jgi:hypothetical protein